MVHAALIGMGITSSESGIHFRYIVSSAAVKDININLPAETAFLHKCFNQGKQLLILEGDTLICLSCPHNQFFLRKDGDQLPAYQVNIAVCSDFLSLQEFLNHQAFRMGK